MFESGSCELLDCVDTWLLSRPRSGFVRPIFLSASSPPTPTISLPGLSPHAPRVLWQRLGQFSLLWCITPARVSSSLLLESSKRHALVARLPFSCTLSSLFSSHRLFLFTTFFHEFLRIFFSLFCLHYHIHNRVEIVFHLLLIDPRNTPHISPFRLT